MRDYIKSNTGNLSTVANVHNMGCSDKKSKGGIKVDQRGNECVKMEREDKRSHTYVNMLQMNMLI